MLSIMCNFYGVFGIKYLAVYFTYVGKVLGNLYSIQLFYNDSFRPPTIMSKLPLRKKRRNNEPTYISTELLNERLPSSSKFTVKKHINTIYVGSIIRIYDPSYMPGGQLATAHWVANDGLFVTLHDEGICTFIDLKYKSWVVDHGFVKPGAIKLFSRYGTNDIEEEGRNHTINEKKKKNSKILMNDTLMDFPTQADRDTYDCSLFRLTCNCGSSKKVKKFTCSLTNRENAGKKYYGCLDRYSSLDESCNFFAWEHEIEHGKFVTCECGDLCKKVNVSKKGVLPVYKFVCINRHNKLYPGCKHFEDC